jgi:hypothetical protein
VVATALHGGSDPGNLRATLPVYAANSLWEVVHLGQFVGYLLLLGGLVALATSLADGVPAALARFGLVLAVVAVAIYGANQGVDGVAIKFVARQWVAATPAHKAQAFAIADAVRHIEIGLTSLFQFTLGGALLLFGLATAMGAAYPRLLGIAGAALGLLYLASGALLAHYGFTFINVTAGIAGVLLAAWFLVLAVLLWRNAAKAPTPITETPQ